MRYGLSGQRNQNRKEIVFSKIKIPYEIHRVFFYYVFEDYASNADTIGVFVVLTAI